MYAPTNLHCLKPVCGIARLKPVPGSINGAMIGLRLAAVMCQHAVGFSCSLQGSMLLCLLLYALLFMPTSFAC